MSKKKKKNSLVKDKNWCPIYFFGIGPCSIEYLRSLSDQEFFKLFQRFDYYYDKAITDFNQFYKSKYNHEKYPFIADNINLKSNIMVREGVKFSSEAFRRSGMMYGWTRNQYRKVK